MAAVQVETGRCQLQGCVITDNQGFGVLIGSQGYAEVEHCDVSFNHESGLWVRGKGRVVGFRGEKLESCEKAKK